MIENIPKALIAGAPARGRAKAEAFQKRVNGPGGWAYLAKFWGLVGFFGGIALLVRHLGWFQ